ncbi:hypothetical protein FHQ28_05620 [Pasteurellaceae bacterium USgator11]|nr:hypothetical protein FHQ20_07880 [Pasteurellaceae bacterium USgator41]TNG96486.1 hypothetical protein FHQ19_02055 [Pasteurellaceae bacterium UScroc12]TNH00471.1 hypothetical protein FHQ24_03570 [Pasteurellaceae bacterium UScroc31]TNH01742.1 hypothetical protein FHQ28_05620 [Pasteurellaceae bacterium USgator11]
MKFMNLSKFSADPGAGGSAGGDSDKGTQGKAFTQEDVDRLIAERVANEVNGLKTKNGELLGNNKALKEQLAKFGDLDPEAVTTIMKQFENDEDMKMIAEGKYHDVIEKRVAKVNEAKQRELDAVTTKHQEETKALQGVLDRYAGLVLENAIRAEAQKAGVTFGVDDAVLRAKLTFKLDDGLVVPADENTFGGDGKPLTLKEWFNDMKEKAPHWFPANQGGGGHSGAGAGSKTMTRDQFDALDPQARMEAIKNQIKIVE